MQRSRLLQEDNRLSISPNEGFNQQTGNLLAHSACLLSYNTTSRIHSGSFRKPAGNLLSHSAVGSLISVLYTFTLVASASQQANCFLKLRFAYSFQ
jgi:hypothetical protein